MLADFELAAGRSTALTQLASPRFEDKQALSSRQMEDGKLLDHPQLGGDFRASTCRPWRSLPPDGRKSTPSKLRCWRNDDPERLAVLRFMIKSNLAGCLTGRSASLLPLKILST